MKRFLKYLLLSIAALAVLFVGGTAAAYFLLDVDGLVNRQVQELTPKVEEKLGRKVSVGRVQTSFFPTLGARVSDIRVGGAPGENDLVAVGSAGIELSLWHAIKSGGKELGIDGIYVNGLKAELIRRADGTLSIQDILDRQPKEEPAPAKKDEGISPDTLKLLQRISIDEILVSGAELRLIDHQTATGAPAESTVKDLFARVTNVRLGDAVGFELFAAVFQDQPNFAFSATVGPIPADLKIDGLLPVRGVHLKADGVDLSRLAPYLGDAVPAKIDKALFSADLRLPELAPGKPADLAGFLAVKELQVAGGTPFDLRLDTALRADLAKLGVDIQQLDLQVGEMKLAARGVARDLAGKPSFENFTIQSSNLDPRLAFAYYPPAAAGLPEGAKLAGPIALDVKASGDKGRQTVAAKVDLTAVEILVPGTLNKPKDIPFSLAVDGDFSDYDVNLRQAVLRLDELALEVIGGARDFANPVYDFAVVARPFSFDRLVRLAPSVAAQLEAAQAKAAGTGSLKGHLQGAPGKMDAQLDVQLTGAKLAVPDTTVEGDVKLQVSAAGDPAGELRAKLLLDAGQAVIRVKDLLDKSAATPMVVDVQAVKSKEAVRFDRFDVRLAELRAEATGALSTGGGDSALTVKVPKVDLEKLSKTFLTIPAEKVKGGFLETELSVKGNPEKPETMTVEVPRFLAKLGKSDLAVRATVRNLAAPDITASITSKFLDVDALKGESAGEGGEEKTAEPKQDDPELKKYQLDGTFDLQRAIVSKRDLSNVKGHVTLKDGVLVVDQASFGVYGGTVSAAGTTAEIWRGKMPFHAKMQVKDVEVDRVLVGELDKAGFATGKANFDIDVSGAGFELADLEQSLTGDWSLAMRQGRLSRASVTRAVLGDLAELPGVTGNSLASEEGAVRELLAGFSVQNGKMKLKKPLRLGLDGSEVVLDGAVGVAGDLFLDGTYEIPAAMLARLTGGKCAPKENAAIPLKITGPATKPEVRPDGKGVAMALAKGCLADKLAGAAKQLLGDDAAKAIESADKAAEQAKAEAAEKARAVEAAAKAEADKAKAEAARRKKAAEDAAKKKAADEAKKLKDRFGF